MWNMITVREMKQQQPAHRFQSPTMFERLKKFAPREKKKKLNEEKRGVKRDEN